MYRKVAYNLLYVIYVGANMTNAQMRKHMTDKMIQDDENLHA